MMFEVLDQTTSDGYHILKITDGEFDGLKFSFGRVEFKENDDDPMVSFTYDILDGGSVQEHQRENFESVLGSILHGLILEQLDNNEIIYGGGTDED